MCKAMEDYTKKSEVNGVIKYLRGRGEKDSDIITEIVKQFSVTAEYVKALMQPTTTN